MMTINGTTLIEYLINSLLSVAKKEQVIIATSERDTNDPIRQFAKEKGIGCFSGSEDDVASRFYHILKTRDSTYFHRICGDTPYYDASLITRGNKIMHDEQPDFVSSMPERGYPMGCNLELFRTKLFMDAFEQNDTCVDHEHVTAGFYRAGERFNGRYVHCNIPGFRYEDFKFSVDTKEDFELAEKMLERMNYTPWNFTFEEKIRIQQNLR